MSFVLYTSLNKIHTLWFCLEATGTSKDLIDSVLYFVLIELPDTVQQLHGEL
jgi:hypothetical protein